MPYRRRTVRNEIAAAESRSLPIPRSGSFGLSLAVSPSARSNCTARVWADLLLSLVVFAIRFGSRSFFMKPLGLMGCGPLYSNAKI